MRRFARADCAMHANRLIARLPAVERRRLLDLSTQVSLTLGHVVADQDSPSAGLLFPMQGFVCLVTQAEDHAPLQLGMVGSEGVLGAHLILGVSSSPVGALVQVAGQACSLPASSLCQLLPLSPALHKMLMRYLAVQWRDTATAASCLRFHPLQARLARWLLMCRDRTRSDDFVATQSELAQRLGVRRVGVTEAAGQMQQAGFIHYERGRIVVTDRSGLEAAACSCYEQARLSYRLGMRFSPDEADPRDPLPESVLKLSTMPRKTD